MSGWITGLMVIGEFCLLVALELGRPLRRPVEPKLRRVARNLAVSVSSAFAVRLAESPVIQPLSTTVERRKLGLLKQLPLPGTLETALAVILMDYTLYIWHRLMHRSELIWRFHLPHHIDLDLDASTALRFHFSELILSVPWRAGQILIIGVSPTAFSIWQTATMLAILFHHSNVRLPIELEQRLCRFIVTPRMHGIHHSIVQAEEESNFSSGLTVWDALHGTLKLNVPQDEITIGVPAYRDPGEARLIRVLMMPFRKQRPTWQLPNDGQPSRDFIPARTNQLLA
jgi:sterol desaturase/sphingolipid hydroxylase (fatty acid hydroxylase superfamily)